LAGIGFGAREAAELTNLDEQHGYDQADHYRNRAMKAVGATTMPQALVHYF
jgi:hypothetical protein